MFIVAPADLNKNAWLPEMPPSITAHTCRLPQYSNNEDERLSIAHPCEMRRWPMKTRRIAHSRRRRGCEVNGRQLLWYTCSCLVPLPPLDASHLGNFRSKLVHLTLGRRHHGVQGLSVSVILTLVHRTHHALRSNGEHRSKGDFCTKDANERQGDDAIVTLGVRTHETLRAHSKQRSVW